MHLYIYTQNCVIFMFVNVYVYVNYIHMNKFMYNLLNKKTVFTYM